MPWNVYGKLKKNATRSRPNFPGGQINEGELFKNLIQVLPVFMISRCIDIHNAGKQYVRILPANFHVACDSDLADYPGKHCCGAVQ